MTVTYRGSREKGELPHVTLCGAAYPWISAVPESQSSQVLCCTSGEALDSGYETSGSEVTFLFSASLLARGMGAGLLPVQRLGWHRHSGYWFWRKHPKPWIIHFVLLPLVG